MASAGVLARPRPAHGPLGEAPAPTSAAASATAPPLLEVSGLTHQYRTPARVVTATWRIDLDVCEGDRLVLLGASGCGKSSLLKAVAGFLAPGEGEIRLAGRPVSGPGPDRVVVPSPHPGRVVADIDTAPLAGMLPEDGPFRLMARKLGSLLTRIGEEAPSPAREAA